jgi:hypothetical protein
LNDVYLDGDDWNNVMMMMSISSHGDGDDSRQENENALHFELSFSCGDSKAWKFNKNEILVKIFENN